MTIETSPEMPPLGVVDDLLSSEPPADRFLMWLHSHQDVFSSKRFWRTAVLRQCLPADDVELTFSAIGALVK